MLIELLTIAHVVGVTLGVGGAFFAEVFYLRAIRDGVIDPTESDFLKITYKILRVGIIFLIFTGFGFFILYRLNGNSDLLYSAKYWVKMTFLCIILLNALLLQAKRIPFWLGSTISFTSWFAALAVGAMTEIPGTYLSIMLWYVLALIVTGGVLEVIRKNTTKI